MHKSRGSLNMYIFIKGATRLENFDDWGDRRARQRVVSLQLALQDLVSAIDTYVAYLTLLWSLNFCTWIKSPENDKVHSDSLGGALMFRVSIKNYTTLG